MNPAERIAALEKELAEAQRLADFWMGEAQRAFQARDEAQHDLRQTRSEREQDLMRAFADLGVIWSRGVRP